LKIQERFEANLYKGPGFDRIRLIAATIVVLHHCSIYLYPDISNDYLFRYSRGFIQFGRLAVDIFFALSGFLVAPRLVLTGDAVTFTVHRALRIMPALAVSVFLAMLVTGPLLTTHTLWQYFTDPQTYRYARNLVFLTTNTLPGVVKADGGAISVNGALWTLSFEVLCYASLVIMSILGILAKRSWTIAVFATAYAMNALLWYVPSLRAAIPDRIETFVSLFVYFSCGACIYRLADIISWSARAAAAAAIAIAVGLPCGAGALVMPICVPYLVIYVGLSHLLGRAPFVNDYSYGIYVFHAQLVTFMLIMFPGVRNFFIAAPLIMAGALAIAILSWTFVEAPSLRSKKWLSSRVRKNVEWIGLMPHKRSLDSS